MASNDACGSPSQSCLKRPALEDRGCSHGLAESNDNNIESLIADVVAQQLAGVQTGIVGALTPMVKNLEKRADKHEKAIAALQSDAEAAKKEREDLKADLSLLRKQLAVADTKPRSKSVGAVPRDPDESDPCLVRLSSANLVALDAVQTSVNALLARAELKPDVAELQGPQLGRNFRLVFIGDDGLASRRARKTSNCLRLANGTWENLLVTRPEGQGQERLFVGLDRSSNEIKKSRSLRFLKESIEKHHPLIQAYKLPRESAIAVSWQIVAELEESSDFGSVSWKAAASSHNINTELVDDSFAKLLEEHAETRRKRL